MKCSLNAVLGWLALATALLLAAIAVAHLWPLAWPLLGAAALVASVSGFVLPRIKQALKDYAACRGPLVKCSISSALDPLGQVAVNLSAVSFAFAAGLQFSALALIASFFLAWLGVAAEVAVVYLVYSGIGSCAIALAILAGILTNALAFKSCADKQPNVGGAVPSTPIA